MSVIAAPTSIEPRWLRRRPPAGTPAHPLGAASSGRATRYLGEEGLAITHSEVELALADRRRPAGRRARVLRCRRRRRARLTAEIEALPDAIADPSLGAAVLRARARACRARHCSPSRSPRSSCRRCAASTAICRTRRRRSTPRRRSSPTCGAWPAPPRFGAGSALASLGARTTGRRRAATRRRAPTGWVGRSARCSTTCSATARHGPHDPLSKPASVATCGRGSTRASVDEIVRVRRDDLRPGRAGPALEIELVGARRARAGRRSRRRCRERSGASSWPSTRARSPRWDRSRGRPRPARRADARLRGALLVWQRRERSFPRRRGRPTARRCAPLTFLTVEKRLPDRRPRRPCGARTPCSRSDGHERLALWTRRAGRPGAGAGRRVGACGRPRSGRSRRSPPPATTRCGDVASDAPASSRLTSSLDPARAAVHLGRLGRRAAASRRTCASSRRRCARAARCSTTGDSRA